MESDKARRVCYYNGLFYFWCSCCKWGERTQRRYRLGFQPIHEPIMEHLKQKTSFSWNICKCWLPVFLLSPIRRWRWSCCYDQRVVGHSNQVALLIYCYTDILSSAVCVSFLIFYSLIGRQCRRTVVMFYIEGLKTALLNWSCRAHVQVAQVPLSL